MSHRYNLEAFERTMRFLEDCQEKFGGQLVIIMLGDFRQVLPVVRRGTRSDIVQSCINFSSMWIDGTIERRALTQNMRVKTLGGQDAVEADRCVCVCVYVGVCVCVCETERETTHETEVTKRERHNACLKRSRASQRRKVSERDSEPEKEGE